MFLSGTLLNVVAVLVGTTIGVLAGARVGGPLREGLTTGLGLFVVVFATFMALSILTSADHRTGDELAVLGGLLVGVVVGEVAGLQRRLEALGDWFQWRLGSPGDPASAGARVPTTSGPGSARLPAPGSARIAEAFVTASIVYCVGPLTIIGSLDNGLRGDATLLSIKSLLDGVASIAFAAALGPGVYLSALTILVVQGGIAGAAFLLRDVLDARAITAITATGGLILVGMGLRLLELKAVRVANFLPALVFAPLFLRLADLTRGPG